MKSVVARWDAELRFDATSALGGRVATSGDEGALGYRPTELLLAALGACTGMDVISVLRKKRQLPSAYAVEVSGSQRAGHPAVFTEIVVEHVVDGEGVDDAAVERAIVLSATRYCPVTAQLSAGDVRIRHRLRRPGGDAADVTVTGPYGAGLDPTPGPAAVPPQAGAPTAGSDRSDSPT
jgi:putative redox protein